MSRPTELGIRHPKEVTQNTYCPTVTHHGTSLSFKTRHVSRQRNKNQIPFRSSTQRLPQYDIDARKAGGAFVGPQSYHPQKLNEKPCSSIMHRNTKTPNEGLTMVGGNSMVYTTAFVSGMDKEALKGLKDDKFIPRCALNNTFSDTSLVKMSLDNVCNLINTPANIPSNSSQTRFKGVQQVVKQAEQQKQHMKNSSLQGSIPEETILDVSFSVDPSIMHPSTSKAVLNQSRKLLGQAESITNLSSKPPLQRPKSSTWKPIVRPQTAKIGNKFSAHKSKEQEENQQLMQRAQSLKEISQLVKGRDKNHQKRNQTAKIRTQAYSSVPVNKLDMQHNKTEHSVDQRGRNGGVISSVKSLSFFKSRRNSRSNQTQSFIEPLQAAFQAVNDRNINQAFVRTQSTKHQTRHQSCTKDSSQNPTLDKKNKSVSKAQQLVLVGALQKRLGILATYGEYDNFMKVSKAAFKKKGIELNGAFNLKQTKPKKKKQNKVVSDKEATFDSIPDLRHKKLLRARESLMRESLKRSINEENDEEDNGENKQKN